MSFGPPRHSYLEGKMIHHRCRFVGAVLLPCLFALSAAAEPAQPVGKGVYATIETTLPTAGKQIRMYALDGDGGTYFLSDKNPGKDDHFTLVLDRPVEAKGIVANTGKPEGGEALDAGTLQVSTDGKNFKDVATFAKGSAKAALKGQQILAVRLKPSAAQKHTLAIREIAIVSTPAVALYKYPVEYTLVVDDAPELKAWGEKVIRVCERAYQWMGDELASPGYKPPTAVTMTLRSSYKGVAAAGGGRITGSVAYFKKNPKDIGAMVHESVHIQQRYKGRGNPGWLVEGVADYIRFFKYEPGKIGDFNPLRAKYNGSYRITARFLAFVTDKYDKELVKKLNRAMREGTYSADLWKKITGRTVQELDEEWRASLKPKEKKAA
jgi:hypothetical protein